MGKVYRGSRETRTTKSGMPVSVKCHVWIAGESLKTRPLNLCTDVVNHSPTGFEWGYHGSGPAQLAFALALDATHDLRRAKYVHQELKRRIVAELPYDEWTLTVDEVLATIKAIEDEDLVGELGDQSGEE